MYVFPQGMLVSFSGWDAYATGVVFAEIACAAAVGDTTRAGLDTPALMVARNRLFCMRSDYPYLALDGPERMFMPLVYRDGL